MNVGMRLMIVKIDIATALFSDDKNMLSNFQVVDID